jgi:MFS family permease
LLPVVARGPLHLSSGGYGLLLGCFGIGAALSAVVRPRIVARVHVDRLMAIATMAVAAGLLIVGIVHNAVAVGFSLLFVGAAWTLALTATGVAAQGALPAWVRARGMGLWNLSVTGGVAIGSALWGVVASWRLDIALEIAAAALVLLFLATSRYKLSVPESIDVELSATDAPVVTLIPEPSDGPVLVTVRYRVRSEDFDAFNTEMRRVERQRRRTGARQWGLFRDLVDVDVVLETYIVESWAEHLRQHDRTTNTDLAVLGDARRYSIGQPEVSHLISSYAGRRNR